MACSCTKRKAVQYKWTDGTNTVIYASEIEAKAKVLRKGGTYEPVQKG